MVRAGPVKYWSSTELDMAQQSLMQWYLMHIEGEKNRQPRQPYFDKGQVVHSDLIDPFWNKLEAGAETHRNAHDFSRHAVGMWLRRVKSSEEGALKGTSKPIAWRYANEKHVMTNQIRKLAYPLYDFLSEIGKPLKSEWSFEIELRQLSSDGRRMGLHGRIDEIRLIDGVIEIWDWKTGFMLQRPKVDFYGNQPTVYILSTLLTAYYDPNFAEFLKLRKNDIPNLLRDDIALKKRIRFKYQMLEGKDFDNNVFIRPILTYRTQEHFSKLIKLIHETWNSYVAGEIAPDLTKDVCNRCPVKEICMERAENPDYRKGEQTRFDFVEMLHRVRRVNIQPEDEGITEKTIVTQRRLSTIYSREAKKRERAEKKKKSEK